MKVARVTEDVEEVQPWKDPGAVFDWLALDQVRTKGKGILKTVWVPRGA